MRTVLAAVALVLAGASARANDSTAAFATGGLVLTETDAIALVHEELFVSRAEVRVRYTFENRTGAEVETLVAFPLPDIDLASFSEIPIEQPYPDTDNFVGFTVTVDGRAITPDMYVTATLADRDVTAILGEAGVPVSLFADTLYERLWAIPRETQDALQAQELAFYERDYDAVYPQWTQHVGFTWTQAFPAGRPVIVEHSYRPVIGTRFVSANTLDADYDAEFRARYCLDATDGAEIKRRLGTTGGAEYEGLLFADELGYILTTAANWAGPIGTLDLTIDLGHAENMAATCLAGLTEASPATLVGHFTDIVPDRDLWVLIVRHDPES